MSMTWTTDRERKPAANDSRFQLQGAGERKCGDDLSMMVQFVDSCPIDLEFRLIYLGSAQDSIEIRAWDACGDPLIVSLDLNSGGYPGADVSPDENPIVSDLVGAPQDSRNVSPADSGPSHSHLDQLCEPELDFQVSIPGAVAKIEIRQACDHVVPAVDHDYWAITDFRTFLSTSAGAVLYFSKQNH